MPLYEYQCQHCKAHFEKIQKFSDPPLRKCEKCGGKVERLLSSPAFQFKGSGWYVTDYARKPEKGKEPADAPSKGSETAAKSSDGKGEAPAKTSSESSKSKSTETAPANK